MKSFVSNIKKLKTKKLALYEEELKTKNAKTLSELSKQLELTQDHYTNTSQNLKRQLLAKAEFEASKKQRQALEDFKLSKLRELFDAYTRTFFENQDHHASWLSKGLILVGDRSGTIKTHESYELLGQLVKSTQIRINKDDSLKGELGFVFESRDAFIDCRMTTFAHDLFSDNIYQLASCLFNDN